MYSEWKRDPLSLPAEGAMDDKALTRRAFLLGVVAVAGATVLPAPVKAAGGASIAGGILRSGGVTGLAQYDVPVAAGWLNNLTWRLQDLAGTANTWLQGWVRDTVGKETYTMFEQWVTPTKE